MMGKASMLVAITAAIVAGELVGWTVGLGPLVAAKTIMLGALVCFNCLKFHDPPGSHANTKRRAAWPDEAESVGRLNVARHKSHASERDDQLAA